MYSTKWSLFFIIFIWGCNAKLNFIAADNTGSSGAVLGISPSTHSLAANGSLTFSASGGTPPYNFKLLSGTGTLNSSTGSYTAPAAVGGTETIEVEDSTGSTATATLTIVSSLVASRSTFTQVNGVGVSAPLKTIISGGVPPYTYHLISGTGSIDLNTGHFTQPSAPGAATIEVRDSFNNTVSLTVTHTPQVFDGHVSSLTTDGTSVYASGSFRSINAQVFDAGFFSINTSDGNLVTNDCHLTSHVTGGISIVLKHSGFYYLLGNFTQFNGTTVQNVAKINASTCSIDSTFTASTGFSQMPQKAVIMGTSLYVLAVPGTYRGTAVDSLTKIDLTTGALDVSFSQASLIEDAMSSNPQLSVLVGDGTHLYVGGYFDRYEGAVIQNIAKIHGTTGALDTTFTTSNGFNTQVTKLVLAHNSLYVGGLFTSYRSTPANYIAKLNLTNGSLDTTFTTATGFNFMINDMIVVGNSVYVAGGFATYRGAQARRLVKLDHDDGDLDPTFGDAGADSGVPSALISDGNFLYVYGQLTSTYKGTSAGNFWKINLTDGSLVTPFENFQKLHGGVIFSHIDSSTLLVQTSLYGGTKASAIAKFNPSNFAIDSTFTDLSGGSASASKIRYGNSSIYLAGSTVSKRGIGGNILKIDPTTGALDGSFTTNACSNMGVFDLAVSSAGVFYSTISGFGSCGGNPSGAIVRLHPNNGTYDSSFVNNTAMGSGRTVDWLELGGSFLYFSSSWIDTPWTFKGAAASPISRLNLANGAVDYTFTGSGDIANQAAAMLYTNDSLYFLNFINNTFKGSAVSYFMKVDTTGALDTTFTKFPGFDDDAHTLAADTTHIYVHGQMTTYDGTSVGKMIKVHKDTGVLDTSFNATMPYWASREMVVVGNYVFVTGFGSNFMRVNKNTGALE